jgi:hypothetical protein
MDHHLSRTALHQTRETLSDVRVFNLEKRRFDKSKASPFSYRTGCGANVVVRFAATTAVTNNQYSDFPITSHAADTASAINKGSQ